VAGLTADPHGTLAAVEHHHRCVYCATQWFCHEDCPYAGPSACADCRDRVRASPGITRRVVRLTDSSVLQRLADREGQLLRDLLRRRRSQ